MIRQRCCFLLQLYGKTIPFVYDLSCFYIKQKSKIIFHYNKMMGIFGFRIIPGLMGMQNGSDSRSDT